MEMIIVILLILSAVIFLLSFFKKDRVKELEKEIDTLSLSYMQDIYQLKKRLSILEEELLIQGPSSPILMKKPAGTAGGKGQVNEIIRNQVLSLSKQGLSIEQISSQSTLPREEILVIIESAREKGERV
ncbi:hypothetical protein [Peribacillus kribbensis]|uniref:hypothetical protein n=1 Tax=Peribacillus kribbensis TaxID=356658 RepID=UPI0004119BC4|nr:hypothetical protein [Peribacillus kribbensis]